MNKKLLFVIPLFALCLAGCESKNASSNPTADYDDDDEDTSYPPGTQPDEPSGGESSGSGSDSVTSEEDVTITGISGITQFPSSFDGDEGIDLTEVTLTLSVSGGGSVSRHPDDITYDISGKSAGDVITVTAHYGTYSIEFESTLVIAPRDVIDVTKTGSVGNTYVEWTCDSTVSDAKYDGATNGNGHISFGQNVTSGHGFPGIVTTHSGGRVKRIKISWDVESTTSDSAVLLVYGKTTPFIGHNDLQSLTKPQANLQLQKQEEEFVYTVPASDDYYYLGFKASGAAVSLFSITVYWDTEKSAPTLSSMEYDAESTATAEVGDTEWDLSGVKVNGTYSDGSEMDITELVDLTSDTEIPTSTSTAVNVSVTATYKRDISKTYTGSVAGTVTAATVKAASWAFENTVSGGELDKTFPKGTSGNKDFLQDVSNDDAIGYLQIKSSTAYWTTFPAHILFTATLGGGNVKTFDPGYYITAVLLDSSGNEIAESEMTVTDNVTKDPTEYPIEFPSTANVYGVKIKHKKLHGFNARFYSIDLRYIA